MASLNIRARKMLEDFTFWYNNSQVRRILAENNVSDAFRESRPLAYMLRRYVPTRTRIKEYRLKGFDAARLLKYFVKNKKLTSRQAATLLQQLEAGYSVRVDSVMVVKKGSSYEAVVPAEEANLAWNLKSYLQK